MLSCKHRHNLAQLIIPLPQCQRQRSIRHAVNSTASAANAVYPTLFTPRYSCNATDIAALPTTSRYSRCATNAPTLHPPTLHLMQHHALTRKQYLERCQRYSRCATNATNTPNATSANSAPYATPRYNT